MYSIPPGPYYRLPTNPLALASLFTDGAEQDRKFLFNRRWGLPDNAVISDSVVRSSSILIQEAHHLVQNYPRERLLFVTLTFRTEIQAKLASRAFNNINRRLLGGFLEAWVKVVDVHENGRNHIHAIAVTKRDVLSGTDLTKVREFLNTAKAADNRNGELCGSERRTLRNATSENSELAFIWALLDLRLNNFGFGWVYDAFPVILPPTVPGYLRKAYLRARWYDASRGIKHSRRLAYSSNLRRKFPGGRTPRSQRSIRNEQALLAAFGLHHRDQWRDMLGRQWGFFVLKCLPDKLQIREPLDVFTPADLARRILTLLTVNLYLRLKLEPLWWNLALVAAGHPGDNRSHTTMNGVWDIAAQSGRMAPSPASQSQSTEPAASAQREQRRGRIGRT